MRLQKRNGEYVLAPDTSDEARALDALVTLLVRVSKSDVTTTTGSRPSAPVPLRVVTAQ